MRYFASLLAILIASVPTNPALADATYTYDFSVPVQVGSLPAGAKLAVACEMYSAANQTGTQVGSAWWPSTTTTQATTNGGWSGTANMQVTTSVQALSYRCALAVYNGSPNLANLINWVASITGWMKTQTTGWTGTMLTAKNLPCNC
jgi:hypothetical protein